MDAKKKRLEKRLEKDLEKTSAIEGGKPSSKKQSNPKKAKNPASTRKSRAKVQLVMQMKMVTMKQMIQLHVYFVKFHIMSQTFHGRSAPVVKSGCVILVNTVSPRSRLVTSATDQPFAMALVDKFLITFNVGLPTYYLNEIE